MKRGKKPIVISTTTPTQRSATICSWNMIVSEDDPYYLSANGTGTGTESDCSDKARRKLRRQSALWSNPGSKGSAINGPICHDKPATVQPEQMKPCQASLYATM